MEYDSTDSALSIQEAIRLAKAAANTIIKSPPRLYDGDFCSVHLWTDNPGIVNHWNFGESDGVYSLERNINFFLLTLKVEPSIVEIPISWDKKLRGWLMREKPQPETYFDGYYIIFDHKFWVERRHENDIEIFRTEEEKDKDTEQMLQKLFERLDPVNNVQKQDLYKRAKDKVEKELKSRREFRESLGHYWRFHVKPNRTVDFVGESEGKLPTNPSLAPSKC